MPWKEWTDGRGQGCAGRVPGVTTTGYSLGIKMWLHEGPREAWVMLILAASEHVLVSLLGVVGEDYTALPWKTVNP